MEEQVELVGKAFVDHYYHLFDTNRASLSSLYQPTSMLSFEGQKIQGMEEIASKLTQLLFDQCHHSIIVFVSGNLQLQGEKHHLRFSQMFHLIPTPQGSFFVQNNIFRLNYD
ncbi:hypothetical protein NE237_029718 [Protea cynaroides]|uniref:NTF2 domain-containing protein n=1 Tax=Protea cynaroides TaxID=273540 RepID=A0A9Q0GTP4_9MAGN|nr:hypothetical protein NE237_029718 [Protea cynaroides]